MLYSLCALWATSYSICFSKSTHCFIEGGHATLTWRQSRGLIEEEEVEREEKGVKKKRSASDMYRNKIDILTKMDVFFAGSAKICSFGFWILWIWILLLIDWLNGSYKTKDESRQFGFQPCKVKRRSVKHAISISISISMVAWYFNWNEGEKRFWDRCWWRMWMDFCLVLNWKIRWNKWVKKKKQDAQNQVKMTTCQPDGNKPRRKERG